MRHREVMRLIRIYAIDKTNYVHIQSQLNPTIKEPLTSSSGKCTFVNEKEMDDAMWSFLQTVFQKVKILERTEENHASLIRSISLSNELQACDGYFKIGRFA